MYIFLTPAESGYRRCYPRIDPPEVTVNQGRVARQLYILMYYTMTLYYNTILYHKIQTSSIL